jgi:hypothetical protein
MKWPTYISSNSRRRLPNRKRRDILFPSFLSPAEQTGCHYSLVSVPVAVPEFPNTTTCSCVAFKQVGDRQTGLVFIGLRGKPLVEGNVNKYVLKPILKKLEFALWHDSRHAAWRRIQVKRPVCTVI